MKKINQLFGMFAVITAIWLVINLILIPLNWEIVFHDKDITNAVEFLIIFGFLFIMVFDISVIGWIIVVTLLRKNARLHYFLLAGAILCFFVLAAAKVMTDEVGRESMSGLGASGEYLIFNFMVGLQILYNLYFIIASRRLNEQRYR